MSRIWARSENGELEFRSLTDKYLPGALSVMRHSFFVNEPACKVVGLQKNEKACDQFEAVLSETAEDGVSLVAVDVSSDNVVGAALNKIQIKGRPSFLDKYKLSTNNQPEFSEILNFSEMGELIDIFEHYNINCALDHMFLATHPRYYRQGIAKQLVVSTVEMASALFKNEEVAVRLSQSKSKYPRIEEKPPPTEAVIALFTSPASQSIGKNLGWDEIIVTPYDKLLYNGETYASKLDKDCRSHIYMALKLK